MLKRPSINTRPTNIRRIKKPATLTYDGFINPSSCQGVGLGGFDARKPFVMA